MTSFSSLLFSFSILLINVNGYCDPSTLVCDLKTSPTEEPPKTVSHPSNIKKRSLHCGLSDGNKILTCENVDFKTSPFKELIKAETYFLIIKNSNVDMPSNYHSDKHFQQIVTYHLTENRIDKIDGFAFKEMNSLRYLHAKDNEGWSVIRSNTFAGLHNLETLMISNNSVNVLEENAFAGLSNLDVLELIHNNFPVVPSTAFKSLKKVTSLFIHHNHINELKDDSFEGLESLHTLDITFNEIKTVKAVMFNGLPELRYLYLSHNDISSLEGQFNGQNLKYLYLRLNKLHSISNQFSSQSNLKSLDISHNKIGAIDDDAFLNLNELELLTLNYNNLHGVSNLKLKAKPLIIS